MNRIITSFVFFATFLTATSQPIDNDSARKFVQKWLVQNDAAHSIKSINNINELIYFELYPEGFVILNGDQSMKPIIGYSFNNNLRINNVPSALEELLIIRNNYIQSIKKKNTLKVASFWDYIPNLKSGKAVEPLISTKWGQGFPYNSKIPNDNKVGCVPVAMGQLMKYYGFPEHGIGKKSFNDSILNFTNSVYNWNLMPNSINTVEDEISQLLFHAGISTNTGYEKYSSGTNSALIGNAMNEYFGYKLSEMTYLFSDSALWFSSIFEELDNKRPILCGGVSQESVGHSFLIDGYNSDSLVHINWGWNGNGDGYFDLNNIDYSRTLSAYFGIYPRDLVADFTIENISGDLPFTISFKDKSMGLTDIKKWEWDFQNDGVIDSYEQNPSISINNYGTFDVKLTVSNDHISDSIIKSRAIYIPSPITPKYVSVSGDDNKGDGSIDNPFKTIQHAVNLSNVNNDTIIVFNGVYHENIDFLGKNLFVSSNFSFSGNEDDIFKTIIDGNQKGSVVVFDKGENNKTHLIGFTIQNGSGDYIHPHWVAGNSKRYIGGGIRCDNASSPKLSYLIIKNNNSEAIYTAQNSNIAISNCVINSNQKGLYLHTSDVTIDSTYILNNDDYGVNNVSENKLKFNRSISAFNGSHTYNYGSGINFTSGKSSVVANSIIYGNKSARKNNIVGGIYVHAMDVQIINSVISGNYPHQITLTERTCAGGELTIMNSLAEGGKDSVMMNSNYVKLNWLENNLSSSSSFLNADNYEFRLRDSSECIDNGINHFNYENNTIVSIQNSDIIGENCDIGVFECGSEKTMIEKIVKRETNKPPTFISVPDSIARPNITFEYKIKFEDLNNDTVQLTAKNLPDWLSLTKIDYANYILKGTPTLMDTGIVNITLELTDGIISNSVIQSFDLLVGFPTSIEQFRFRDLSIYPNPVTDKLYFTGNRHLTFDRIIVYNNVGKAVKLYSNYSESEISVNNLSNGIFYIQFIYKNRTRVFKILINKS